MNSAEDEILHVTEDIIKFKTVKGNNEEFDKALNYIREYFESSGLKISEHEKEGVKSLVVKNVEDPELMLHGHLDVVDGEDEMFNPVERNGRLYGRGSADMKSGLACLMKVLKETYHPSIGLMIVSDEEVGGFNGAKYLVENFYSPEFVISAEPNNTDGYLKIINKQKGVVRATISAEGKNAHGSRPWNGENAAEKLWEKYFQLKKNFSTEKEEWGTTVNLGNFTSKGAVNVVPDYAEAGLDIRYTEKYDPEQIENDIMDIEGLNFEINAVDPMLDTDAGNSVVQKLKSVSEDVIDKQVEITRKEPASDVRHFSQQGIPGVVFGPEGYNVHEDGEYLVISSLEDYYDCIQAFITKVT
ncbi:MAG: M20/M25/M40 family metallo-hydrolase [Candidatus Nanohaloarchaea archaeon]